MLLGHARKEGAYMLQTATFEWSPDLVAHLFVVVRMVEIGVCSVLRNPKGDSGRGPGF
jgi:hypothetical protein